MLANFLLTARVQRLLVRRHRKVTCRALDGMMLSTKQAATDVPMGGRSVEHILLRLLTPVLLLFLFAHIVSPALNGAVPAPGERPANARTTHYVDDGSAAEHAARPGKAQGRNVRLYEARSRLPKPEPGGVDIGTAIISTPGRTTGGARAVALSGAAWPAVSVSDRRTQNPRDPPRRTA
jgi:hypothetical protein